MLAPGPCEGPEQVHHLVKRSHGGPHDLDNLMLLCAFHHRWVETHSVEAHALGLHRWSWERPA